MSATAFRRFLLPTAAVVIVALCAWKQLRTHDDRPDGARLPRLPAPEFEELDQHMRPVRLKTYLGRHRILLVFFDGRHGADRDPLLMRVREESPALESAGFVVLAVSDARPVQNRRAAGRVGGFPFPLLSDVDYDTYRAWGMLEGQTPQTGLFVIDRASRVAWDADVQHPVPQADPQATLDGILDR